MGSKEDKEAKKAEAQAKKEAERAAREKAKQDTENAKEAKKAEAQAKKEAEQTAREEARGKGKNTDGELVSGIINLNIMPPVDLTQLKTFEENLKQVQDLRLILVGGSMDEGTEIVVSAENPIPILDVSREMPTVAEVNRKGKTTQITLKSE